MYGWDTLVLLKHYLDSGLSKAAIARRLGLSRGVIYHWLRTGQLERDLSQPQVRRLAPRPTKLDPYHPLIQERLTTYPELFAVRLFGECRAAGYPGGYSQLKAYVARVRPRPTPEPVVRFETAPGEQAQFDFAEVRFPWGKRFVLLVVLGYSRLLHAEFVARQTALTVMLGLERAFQTFGGLPQHVLFDQMKSVIVEDHRPGGGRLLENPEFLRFAAHWGFRIRACRPYRARTKGKVGRPGRDLNILSDISQVYTDRRGDERAHRELSDPIEGEDLRPNEGNRNGVPGFGARDILNAGQELIDRVDHPDSQPRAFRHRVLMSVPSGARIRPAIFGRPVWDRESPDPGATGALESSPQPTATSATNGRRASPRANGRMHHLRADCGTA